jgi:hypothetical protein
LILSLGGVDPAKLPADHIFLTLWREGVPATVPGGRRSGTLDDERSTSALATDAHTLGCRHSLPMGGASA